MCTAILMYTVMVEMVVSRAMLCIITAADSVHHQSCCPNILTCLHAFLLSAAPPPAAQLGPTQTSSPAASAAGQAAGTEAAHLATHRLVAAPPVLHLALPAAVACHLWMIGRGSARGWKTGEGRSAHELTGVQHLAAANWSGLDWEHSCMRPSCGRPGQRQGVLRRKVQHPASRLRQASAPCRQAVSEASSPAPPHLASAAQLELQPSLAAAHQVGAGWVVASRLAQRQARQCAAADASKRGACCCLLRLLPCQRQQLCLQAGPLGTTVLCPRPSGAGREHSCSGAPALARSHSVQRCADWADHAKQGGAGVPLWQAVVEAEGCLQGRAV